MTPVQSWPRSAEAIDPTCRLPFSAITFDGVPCTVVRPVSSTLKIREAVNCFSSYTFASKSTKAFTFTLLKAIALATEVASGERIESDGWRDKKPFNQSTPAAFLEWLKLWFKWFCSASSYARHRRFVLVNPKNIVSMITRYFCSSLSSCVLNIDRCPPRDFIDPVAYLFLFRALLLKEVIGRP